MENLNESKNRMRHLMGYEYGSRKNIIKEQITSEIDTVLKDTADNVAELLGCEKFYDEGKEEVMRIIPNTIKELGDRFDEVWEEILENFECGDPSDEEFEKYVPDEFKNATDTTDVNESIGRIKQVMGYNTSKILSEQTIINEQGNWWDNKGKVKVFQDWLDANHPDWINNGKGLQKGGGYGNFGPKTTAAWRKYGKEADKQTGLTSHTPKTQTKQVTAKTTDTAFPFTNADDGNKFRAWVNDTYPNYAKQIDLDSEGSYDNKYIRKAWDKLGDKYLAASNPNVVDALKQKLTGIGDMNFFSDDTGQCELTGNFLIPVAWPTYEPSIESSTKTRAGRDVSTDDIGKSLDTIAARVEIWGAKVYSKVKTGETGGKETYGKLGHGGIAMVKENGTITLYEFGRYKPHTPGTVGKKSTASGMGHVKKRSLKGAIIKNGELTNPESVAAVIKKGSQGKGPKLPMEGHIVPISAEGLKAAIAFAEAGSRKYSASDWSTADDDFNCGTFALSAARAGGIPIGDFCFPDPQSALNSFSKYACNGGSATSVNA